MNIMAIDIKSIFILTLGIFIMPSIAIAQESIPLGETIINSNKVDEKENFVSKNEIDLNSNDPTPLLEIPSASFKISVEPTDKYEIILNGKLIDEKLIGKVQFDKINNNNVYTYYAIPLQEGENQILVKFYDSENKVKNSIEKFLYVKGKPNKIIIDRFSSPADGKTVSKLKIRILDKYDNPVQDDLFINVSTDNGVIKSEDQDPNTNGIQLKTKNGLIEVDILSPNTVSEGNILVSVNDIKQIGKLEYKVPYKKPIMIGLADSKAGYSLLNGRSFENDPKAKEGINFNIGASLFTQGSIFDDYLLTFAFDTRRKLNALNDDQNVMFRDRVEDRLYPIYGDSSQLNQIVTSNSNVFFKLEKDKSSLLFGDFNTGFVSADVTTPRMSNYNRVLNGARLKLDIPEITNLEIFGAISRQMFNRDEFQGAGVSGPYYTSKYPLVNGTERVIIETRDRTFINRILKTTTLTRLSDYNIDYSNGTIIFSQPIPSVDENLNPNFIIITYEYYPQELSNSIIGAKLSQPLGFGLTLGGTYVRELNPSLPYQLAGVSLTEKIGDNFDISAEYANSFFENKYGASYRAGLSAKPLENLSLKGEYQFVEKDFSNRTGNSFAPGTERYFGKLDYKPFDTTSVNLEFNRDKNFTSGHLLQALNGRVNHDIFSHILTGGLEFRQFSNPQNINQIDNSALAILNYKSPSFFNISLNASREQNLLSTQDFTRPTQTSIGLDYAITNNLKLYAKQAFFEREKLTTATIIGADTTFNTGLDVFNSLNMGAKYQIDSTIDGRSSQTRIGFNNRINLIPELALGINFERVNGNNPNLNIAMDETYNAWSFSTEYFPKQIGLRASAKFDLRDGLRASNLFNFNVAGALGDDFGIFGRFMYNNSNELVRTHNMDSLFGIAYRPLNSDFFNALFKYQLRKNHDGLEFSSDVLNNIFSFEGFFQPSYYWEIYTKLAWKNSYDMTKGFNPIYSNIGLGLARITYKIAYNFDIVGEYRNLAQIETGTFLNDFTTELGYFPMKDLRLGLGYNFFGYTDKDLITSNYSAQGPYIALTFKLGNFGDIWGQNNVLTKKDLKNE
jgi:hypothetical protein